VDELVLVPLPELLEVELDAGVVLGVEELSFAGALLVSPLLEDVFADERESVL
jgi:hypothetical protein